MTTRPRYAALVLFFGLLLGQSAIAAAAEKTPTKDEELQQLVVEDQNDRMNTRGKPWPAAITERDRIRRDRTLAILKAGRLRTGIDYSNAALIFQHGEYEDDFRLAY